MHNVIKYKVLYYTDLILELFVNIFKFPLVEYVSPRFEPYVRESEKIKYKPKKIS